MENLAFVNLFQINTIFNRYGSISIEISILDFLLFNSNSHFIFLNKDAIVPVDNYHSLINISYTQFYTASLLSFSKETYVWYESDYNSILSFLCSIKWIKFFKINNDITIITDEFIRSSSMLFTFIPKKGYFESKFPYWFSRLNKSNQIKKIPTNI